MPSLGKARAPASAKERIETDWSACGYSSEDEDLERDVVIEEEVEFLEEEAERLGLQEWIDICSSYKASGQYFDRLERESLQRPPAPGMAASSRSCPAPSAPISPARLDPEVEALQASVDQLQQTASELLGMRMRGGCTSYRQLALVEKLRCQMVQQQNEELCPRLKKARDGLSTYFHLLGRVGIVRQELSRLLDETPHLLDKTDPKRRRFADEIQATGANES